MENYSEQLIHLKKSSKNVLLPLMLEKKRGDLVKSIGFLSKPSGKPLQYLNPQAN